MNKKQKKKLFIYLLIPVLLLIILWFVGNLTHAFQRFSSPSQANEPTIKAGSGFFASSLKKPERFDFICFQAFEPQMGSFMALFRICGIEGDNVEIRNGDLYVNSLPVDGNLTLSHTYKISYKDFNALDKKGLDSNFIFNEPGDTVKLILSDKFAKDNRLQACRIIRSSDEINQGIAAVFGKNWNSDHFGPVRVPAGHFFLLGDNRDHASDSRYMGFISKENFIATVLGK